MTWVLEAALAAPDEPSIPLAIPPTAETPPVKKVAPHVLVMAV